MSSFYAVRMHLCKMCGEHRHYPCHKVKLVQQRLRDHLKCEGVIIALGLRSSQLCIENRSSQLRIENRSSQLRIENRGSQLRIENRSSQLRIENRSSQLRIENRSSQLHNIVKRRLHELVYQYNSK